MSRRLKHTSLYHRVLRVAALVLALVLLFDSGIVTPVTRQLSQQTQLHMANVIGVQARVEPTELNQLTAALTERELALDTREAVIVERELQIGLQASDKNIAADPSTYVISTLLFIIIVLIVLNYILDYRRAYSRQNVLQGI